jgi:hypothetical protein
MWKRHARIFEWNNIDFVQRNGFGIFLILHRYLIANTWHILKLRMKGYLEIWRVGANILNKNSRTPDKLIFQIRVWAEELTVVQNRKSTVRQTYQYLSIGLEQFFFTSSCLWRVRRVSCSLILKMKLVPPFLPRSSYVPSSCWSIF